MGTETAGNSNQDRVFEIIFDKDEVTWQTILYELVRSEQMDPWDIDISLLTRKYIDTIKKLKEMDFALSGKVLLAAAILLKVKSSRLVGEDLNQLDRLFAFNEEAEEELYEDAVEPGAISEEKPYLIPRTPQPRKRKVSIYDLVDALEKERLWNKEILTKISCYSEDSIVITGQPKYDIITKIKSSFNREEFCKKWGIDPNRKIAMLLTQILSSEEERSIYLRNVLKAFKEFPEIQVVIKPKANEEWHKQVLVEEGVTDGVVLPNINAYEPMYISDFVSTVSSTAAVEAMFFDKPVLIVNLTNRSDALPLIQSGATVAVTDVKDLATSVKKILYDKETHELLAKAREKFVNDQVYKLDGKSSERVAELVESLINKKEK